MRLTDAKIAAERYRGEPTTGEDGRTQWPACVVWDDEIEGFGVRIYPPVRGRPSRKDFIVTWRVGLKARIMALGTYGVDCTLRQARRMAREAVDLSRRGQDPLEARQRALGIGTAEDLASRFLFEHTAAKKKEAEASETALQEGGDGTGDPSAAEPAGAEPAGTGDTGAAAGAASPPAPEPRSGPGAPPPVAPPGVAASPSAAAPGTAPASAPSPSVAVPSVVVPSTAAPSSEPASVGPPSAPSAPPGPVEAPAATDATTAATGESEAPESRSRPAAPAPADAPTRAEPARRSSPGTPLPRRGPTKVKLLPVPAALHREIDRRARAASLTVAAYLESLLELEAPGVTADALEEADGAGD